MNKTIQVPLSEEDINTLKAGDYVYLSGIIYTARDAAHKRMYESMHKGESLPIELNGNVLYYLGPSPAREGQVIGSAGPTTSSRMDKYTPEMLDKGKIIFLTGNPGDGKTFIIKALDGVIKHHNAFVETDANNQSAYDDLINNIISCYDEGRPAIIAINEYPFLQLRKQMKETSTIIFDEIIVAKKNAITYDTSFDLKNRIVVIDLNERNLLDPDNHIISTLFDRFIELLSSQSNPSKALSYNLKALSIREL